MKDSYAPGTPFRFESTTGVCSDEKEISRHALSHLISSHHLSAQARWMHRDPVLWYLHLIDARGGGRPGADDEEKTRTRSCGIIAMVPLYLTRPKLSSATFESALRSTRTWNSRKTFFPRTKRRRPSWQRGALQHPREPLSDDADDPPFPHGEIRHAFPLESPTRTERVKICRHDRGVFEYSADAISLGIPRR
jgi:hypothetical protein